MGSNIGAASLNHLPYFELIHDRADRCLPEAEQQSWHRPMSAMGHYRTRSLNMECPLCFQKRPEKRTRVAKETFCLQIRGIARSSLTVDENRLITPDCG